MEHRAVAAINLVEKYLDSKISNSITNNAIAIAESSCIIFYFLGCLSARDKIIN